jgi:uncharacterized membrane protein YjgN (DUF898 family)
MDQMLVSPPVPPAPVSFFGDRSEFRSLVTRGALLELVTVGFYRFWLATDIRRHLWSHTTLDDDAFEYTGRGKELLIGFLFALAILVPIYLVYFLVGLEAERFKAFASIPLFAFFYAFGQFAIYRARRYRLTRTVWRGVRFWMSGSGWAYAGRAALWALAMIFTLGLILPWREAALERYKMQHSWYGDLQGSFDATGWDFFKLGWPLWLMLALPLLVAVFSNPLLLLLPGLPPGTRFVLGLLVPLWILALPFIYGSFKAMEWRWWISGIRFGDVRFESDLPSGAVIGIYWKVIGWFLLIVSLFGLYIYLSLHLVASMNQTTVAALFLPGRLQPNVSLIVLMAIGYLAFILALNIVMRIYLLRDLWARVVGSTTAIDLEAAANVAAQGELANALGEGFADGLDVAGF